MTHFIFVRHGQTDWNRENRFRGRADIPLNATGLEQAQRAADALRNTPIAAIYASPLGRTMQTAQSIAQPHGLAVIPRRELLDIDYGDWQGKLPSEIDPEQYARWCEHPEVVKITNGENLPQVRSRVMNFVDSLSGQADDRAVVLVSHDLVGKILICGLMSAPSNSIHRVQQENACIDRFDAENGMYLVRTTNETKHLE